MLGIVKKKKKKTLMLGTEFKSELTWGRWSLCLLLLFQVLLLLLFLNIMIRQFRFICNGLGYYKRIKLMIHWA